MPLSFIAFEAESVVSHRRTVMGTRKSSCRTRFAVASESNAGLEYLTRWLRTNSNG
jgi:hypothetical protein